MVYFLFAGLHLVLCSVALDDAEGGKAAFHAMLDVEPPTYHHDIGIDDVSFHYVFYFIGTLTIHI